MLCYRCGTHVPDTGEVCTTCGQPVDASGKTPGAISMRKRSVGGDLNGAPVKLGDRILNRYEVRDVVGAGPVGFVFRCHDQQMDAEVSFKMVNPRFVQSAEERAHFSRMLRLSHKFHHPGLSRTYDDGVTAQGWPYYTQGFLDGLTLRTIIDLRLSKGQFFTPREVEPILNQLAGALAVAHAQGPHADVKPANVVVQPDLLKVMDFGLALAMPRRPFIQAQRVVGGRYLAPEYVKGFEVDVRADQYSLGVLVGEMLSGLLPEDGRVPSLHAKNPDVDSGVEGFYRRATAESPEGRFGNVRELLTEFQRLAQASPQPARVRTWAADHPAKPGPPVPETAERPEPVPSFKSAGALAVAADPDMAAVTVELPRGRRLKPAVPVRAGVGREPTPVRSLSPRPHPEPLPPDATQPISAEELALRLGQMTRGTNELQKVRLEADQTGSTVPFQETGEFISLRESGETPSFGEGLSGLPTYSETEAVRSSGESISLSGNGAAETAATMALAEEITLSDSPVRASTEHSLPPFFAATRKSSRKGSAFASRKMSVLIGIGLVACVALGWWLLEIMQPVGRPLNGKHRRGAPVVKTLESAPQTSVAPPPG